MKQQFEITHEEAAAVLIEYTRRKAGLPLQSWRGDTVRYDAGCFGPGRFVIKLEVK